LEKLVAWILIPLPHSESRYNNPMIRRMGSFDGPHIIDLHVAQRVKMLRIVLGIKQAELAAALNVSPQQMQKYETGSDRLKSGHLLSLSNILGVEIDFFFEDIPQIVSDMSRLERAQSIPTELKSHDGASSNAMFMFAHAIAKLDADAIKKLLRQSIS